jgi:NAD(P)-dependent dehydrogenase (short-subunit alcohol dehydrogenase family)
MPTKTVLITGSSTDIGAATVERLATAGWKVYAGVRRPQDGEHLTATLKGDITPVILDVTNREHITDVLHRIEHEVGSLSGLVNNAGIGVGGPIELLSDESWRWQMDVNFFSVVTLTREAMPLVDRANGRFVHIGSVSGRLAAAGLGPYSVSKHAVSAFNWALRAELARNTKMRSSVIEPGEIKTAIWDKADNTIGELDAQLTGKLRERYGFLIDQQRAFVADGKSRGIDADSVAQAIEHALTSRRPKARYLVGTDAKAVGVLTLLPDRVRERLMDLNGRRMERTERAEKSKRGGSQP